jgi:transglutaminase-like putative cysteine protease
MQAHAVKILSLIGCIVCLGSLMPTPVAQALSGSFSVAPAPAWVTAEGFRVATSEESADAREGVIRLLSDQQVRVVDKTTERYFHQVEQIVLQPGIEKASQLQLEFDPTYQKLVIHRIQIKRGAQTINALKPPAIKLVQQEDELEERLFNGTLSALVILDDVRVGDIIEYDYSVNGENPILGGRFADVSYLAAGEPTARLRYRLLWPSARPLRHLARGLELQPKVQAQGETTEYVWERTAVAPLELTASTDALAPEWPTLYVSEFQSWQDVVAWALPLYQQPAVLTPPLRQLVEKWQKDSSAPELRLLAALRFVQDEIRYLGIEIGPHSHQPHAPALVLARRYGDCKDKALLLCTLLKALGIAAQPALVNTEFYEQVSALPPSPYAFDHVIVRAQLNGKEYWFDATSSLQRGSLPQHFNPEFGSGLPIQSGITELAAIPSAPSQQPLKTVQEIFTLRDDNTATLELVSIYRGPEADAIRSYLATNSLKDLTQDHLRAYTDTDRSFSAEGKPQVNDDQERNELVVTERFNIGRFWKDSKRWLVADRITQELPWVNLANIPTGSRQPIRLIFPLDVEHLIEVRGAALPARQDEVKHAALLMQWQHTQNGETARLRYRLRTLRNQVSAAEARQLNEAIERMEDVTKVQLSASGRLSHAFNEQARIAGFVGLLLMPLLAWFAVKWLQRKQANQTVAHAAAQATEPLVAPGATPATALPLAELARTRCGCGAAYPDVNWPRLMMQYDGRRVCVLHLRCSACAQPRELHFVMPDSPPPTPATHYEKRA